MSIVLDAGVIVALLVADERQAAARAHLEGRLDGDLEAGAIAETWSDLSALGVDCHPFDLAADGPAVAAITTRLRRRHATDSTYIHLAQRLETQMWTLDGPLARGAAELGLPVQLIA
ncbi:MAG: type II toxin-antitoxin system VapC family toxin [Candidatus Dormibacteraceae bacterium]